MLPGLERFSYGERLVRLELFYLQQRTLRGRGMIDVIQNNEGHASGR